MFFEERNGLKNTILVFVLCLMVMSSSLAQKLQSIQDTITLKTVEINEKKLPVVTQKILPVQAFNRLNLERLSPLQISDAIKHFAGANVKDYGGIGGLKTVSVRSLGAIHTAVSYDGIPLGDCQSGQIDLSRFSTENLEMITLANGQSPEMLQTARALASASLLSMNTATPYFDSTQWIKAMLDIKMGSFQFFNPALFLQAKISSKVSTAFLFDWQTANGDYPFTIDYGDSTSTQRRNNSDIQSTRAEVNIYYFPAENQQLTTKLYFFDSERGLPGAVIFYNESPSAQRLWDKSYFVQTRYKINAPKRISLLFNGKYNYAYTHYFDPDALNMAGKIDNEYKQIESYLSAAINQLLGNNFQYLFTTDGFMNTLYANGENFAAPLRYTWLTALAVQYSTNLLSPISEPSGNKPLLANLQANLLSTFSEDEVETGKNPENKKRLSPTVSFSLQPFSNTGFQVRFFYKDIYRLPTFNDMYYSQIGNPGLRPEIVKQLDVGISYYKVWKQGAHYVSTSADIYNNRITDKIVAIPSKNLFEWSMMNVGKVVINGLDATFRGGFSPIDVLQFFAEGSYTYQRALDMTDSESKLYKNYIPYTPMHSGSGLLGFSMRGFTFSYSMVFIGERYALGQNLPKNLLKGYTDQNISISQKINLKSISLKFSAEILNLLDTQYEVVKWFPMQGRWFKFGVNIGI